MRRHAQYWRSETGGRRCGILDAAAQIGCVREARLLGCRIARAPAQRGLLEIVRLLVDRDSETIAGMASAGQDNGDWFMEILRAADKGGASHLLRILARPSNLRALLR